MPAVSFLTFPPLSSVHDLGRRQGIDPVAGVGRDLAESSTGGMY